MKGELLCEFSTISSFIVLNMTDLFVRTPLYEMDILKSDPTIEYRDKKSPIVLGDSKLRRKSMSLSRKTGSPFFQQWEDTFKGINV